jgi:hypothetical protein
VRSDELSDLDEGEDVAEEEEDDCIDLELRKAQKKSLFGFQVKGKRKGGLDDKSNSPLRESMKQSDGEKQKGGVDPNGSDDDQIDRNSAIALRREKLKNIEDQLPPEEMTITGVNG